MNSEPKSEGNASENDASSMVESFGEFTTGIPAPILKSAYKAFARLCSAAAEYPATFVETKINELKAESDARVRLIQLSAQQIAEQIKVDPSFAQAAANKFAQRIVREQINLDLIGQIAAEELRSQPPKNDIPVTSTDEIADDWLNAFEKEASQMSSEEMQLLFGKILAGEITKPKSFSIRTIKLIAELDNEAALIFRRFCSISISLQSLKGHVVDTRVASLGNAAVNSLQHFGMGFRELNILQEYGLIISDYNGWMDYGLATAFNQSISLSFRLGNSFYYFNPKTPTSQYTEHHVTGPQFTKSGKELLTIVDRIPDETYLKAFVSHFENLGYDIVHVPPAQE